MSMLAPALGVQTWVLNTHNSAWQFGPNDSPVDWFENATGRFWQRSQGDWSHPLRDLRSALRKWGHYA